MILEPSRSGHYDLVLKQNTRQKFCFSFETGWPWFYGFKQSPFITPRVPETRSLRHRTSLTMFKHVTFSHRATDSTEEGFLNGNKHILCSSLLNPKRASFLSMLKVTGWVDGEVSRTQPVASMVTSRGEKSRNTPEWSWSGVRGRGPRIHRQNIAVEKYICSSIVCSLES